MRTPSGQRQDATCVCAQRDKCEAVYMLFVYHVKKICLSLIINSIIWLAKVTYNKISKKDTLLYYSTIIHYNLWIRKIPDLPKNLILFISFFFGTKNYPRSHKKKMPPWRWDPLKPCRSKDCPQIPRFLQSRVKIRPETSSPLDFRKKNGHCPRSLLPTKTRFFSLEKCFTATKNPARHGGLVGWGDFEVNHLNFSGCWLGLYVDIPRTSKMKKTLFVA